MKSNLTQVNKLEQKLYKFLNLRTIMESKRMSVNFSVYKTKFRSTSINCENYLPSEYLRIVASQLGLNLARIVASSSEINEEVGSSFYSTIQ